MRKRNLVLWMFLLTLATLCAYGGTAWASEAASGDGEGGAIALADGPFTFTDRTTGIEIYVYQSVKNEVRLREKEIEKLKYYIAPYFVFLTPKSPDITVVDDKGILTLNVQTFNDGVIDQALELIRGTLPEADRSIVSRSSVSRMSHREMSVEVRAMPGVSIQSIGGQGWNNVHLQPLQPITFHVDKPRIDVFKQLLSKGQLDIALHVKYMGKDVNMAQMGINQQDKALTEKAISYVLAGAAYVDAEEFLNVVTRILTEKNIYMYLDPYVDRKIMDVVLDIFQKESAKQEDFVIRSREDARKIDEALLDGMNLETKNFLPVTTWWDVYEQTHDIVNAKERAKEHEKRYMAFASSIVGKIWGVVNGFAVQGEGDANVKSDEEYEREREANVSRFLDHFKIREGKEVVFTARGLSLVEKGAVERILNAGSVVVLIQPYNKPTDYTTVARFRPEKGKVTAFSVKYSKEKLEMQKNYETPWVETGWVKWYNADKTGLTHLDAKIYPDPNWKIYAPSITLTREAERMYDSGGSWVELKDITVDGFRVTGPVRVVKTPQDRRARMRGVGTFLQYVEAETVNTEKYPITPGNEMNIRIPEDPFGDKRQWSVDSVTVYYDDGSTRVVNYPGTYEGFSYFEKLPRNIIFRALE
ncbi:hypothetical protein AGMMS50276_20640 [Synergistales bacterium]|nr:hypothetical protein AGMMS50276_20640 [Synergistales bacterium]